MAAKKSKSSRSKGINRRNLFITTGLSLAASMWYFSREKSYRQLDSLPGIQKFLQFHEEPQVIFIPQKHTLDPTFISNGVEENQRDVTSICDFLYDDLGVRALAMEGITEKQVEYFEDHGTLPKQIGKRKTQEIEIAVTNEVSLDSVLEPLIARKVGCDMADVFIVDEPFMVTNPGDDDGKV